jgi:hypothetical protein
MNSLINKEEYNNNNLYLNYLDSSLPSDDSYYDYYYNGRESTNLKRRYTDKKYDYTIPNLFGKYSQIHHTQNPKKFKDYKKKLPWGTIYDYTTTNPLDADDLSKKSNEYLDKRDSIYRTSGTAPCHTKHREHFDSNTSNTTYLIWAILIICGMMLACHCLVA